MRYFNQREMLGVTSRWCGHHWLRCALGSKVWQVVCWIQTTKIVSDFIPLRPRSRWLFLVCVCAVVLGACAEKVVLPSSYSQQMGGGHQRVTEYLVSKKKFLASLGQGEGANDARLVTVFRRDRQQLPQYRIFDIRSGSAYHLLGLEDGDIVLAANDHIIYDPAGFRTFVIEYLKDQFEASLTISRGGVATLYRYTFKD